MSDTEIRKLIVEAKLRTPMPNLDRKIFRIMAELPAVSTARLETSNHVKRLQSRGFAKRYGDLFELVDKPNRAGIQREFLAWKTPLPVPPDAPSPLAQPTQDAPHPAEKVRVAASASNEVSNDSATPATPPPIDSEIAARLDLLILWLADSWRSSDWLPEMGFPMAWVHEIMRVPAYAGLIRLERNEQVGHFEYMVSLIKKPEPAQHSLKVVRSTEHKDEDGPFFSKEEWAAMRRRPASRGMASRRGSNINPANVRNRVRDPMIILPTDNA